MLALFLETSNYMSNMIISPDNKSKKTKEIATPVANALCLGLTLFMEEN